MHVTTREPHFLTDPEVGQDFVWGGARILVADDDDDVRALITYVLERNGHHVDAAFDGQRAWELVQENFYDVIVLDVEMPRLSGLELVAKVRAHSSASASRVLMVSGLTSRRDVERARADGADEYVSKPFRLEEFTERIRELIALGPADPLATTSSPPA